MRNEQGQGDVAILLSAQHGSPSAHFQSC